MKKIVSITLGIAVSIVAIYLLFRNIDVSTSINNLKVVPLYSVLVLMTIYLSGFVLRALRWRLMLVNLESLSFKTWLNSIVVGYAGNNVIPARGGELLRMEHFSRTSGVSRTISLSSVLTEKILDGLSLLLILLLVVWLYPGDLLSIVWFKSLFVMANLIFVGAISFLIVLKAFGNPIIGWLKQKQGVFFKLGDLFGKIVESLGFIQPNLKSLVILLIGASIWVVEGGMFVYAFSLLMPDQSVFILGYLTLVVVNFGILIPSSPGYVGVFQAMTVLACSIVGIAEEQALSVSLLIHGSQFIPITLWGLLILGKGLFSKVKQEAN